MAVGASRGEMLSSVFRKALVLAAMRDALGVIGSAIAVRAMAGLLYGVRAENTAMFVLASIVLTLTTLRGQLESSLAGGQHRSHAGASFRVSWAKD